MDIFGIGPTELIFIILIALILLGPKDMQKTGRTIGRFLRNMTTSDGWRAFRDTSREIRNLPTRLMREANLEEIENDVGSIGKEIEEAADIKGFGSWGGPSKNKPRPVQPRPKPAEAKEKQTNPPPPAPEKANKELEDNA